MEIIKNHEYDQIDRLFKLADMQGMSTPLKDIPLGTYYCKVIEFHTIRDKQNEPTLWIKYMIRHEDNTINGKLVGHMLKFTSFKIKYTKEELMRLGVPVFDKDFTIRRLDEYLTDIIDSDVEIRICQRSGRRYITVLNLIARSDSIRDEVRADDTGNYWDDETKEEVN